MPSSLVYSLKTNVKIKWTKHTFQVLINQATASGGSNLTSYRELTVWQKSIDLTVKIYRASQSFPVEERYGITSQIRRAAASIPANIAEGQSRNTTGEFRQFLGIARGSLAELETFLTLCEKLEYLNQKDSKVLLTNCAEINKMLHGLTKSLSTPH